MFKKSDYPDRLVARAEAAGLEWINGQWISYGGQLVARSPDQLTRWLDRHYPAPHTPTPPHPTSSPGRPSMR